ncbi:MAG TPA: T9SS type A sorting domain-containing protein, partial [Prolixibacteraceae bacterium]
TITGMQGETTIELFNPNGILVKTFRTQENSLPISLKSLSDGLYILKCQSRTGSTSLKIVKNSNSK